MLCAVAVLSVVVLSCPISTPQTAIFERVGWVSSSKEAACNGCRVLGRLFSAPELTPSALPARSVKWSSLLFWKLYLA